MRVLVATLPERGHYHPLLGPARELETRGHEVVWTCATDIAPELVAAGAARVAIPSSAPPPSAEVRGEALAAILVDPPRLARWIRRLLVDAPGRTVDAMRSIIRDVKPDTVALDPMAYDAAIAAHLEGVPWVGWSTSLNPVVDEDATGSVLVHTIRALAADRAALFAEHGMLDARFRVSDVLSPRGTACFATEMLAGHPPETIALVGPSLGGTRGGERVDLEFAEDRPLIYVSFGSQAWHQPARFTRISEACERLGCAMVAAMGDLAAAWPAREHVRAVAFADQRWLLPACSAFVTHGGANSVMEACAYGAPMLVAPICNDQPHSAYFVSRARAGIALDLEAATDDALDDALVALATRYRERMYEIRASYARDGSAGAADLVERAS